MHILRNYLILLTIIRTYNATFRCFKSVHICYDLMYIITTNIKTVPINGKFWHSCKYPWLIFVV